MVMVSVVVTALCRMRHRAVYAERLACRRAWPHQRSSGLPVTGTAALALGASQTGCSRGLIGGGAELRLHHRPRRQAAR